MTGFTLSIGANSFAYSYTSNTATLDAMIADIFTDYDNGDFTPVVDSNADGAGTATWDPH